MTSIHSRLAPVIVISCAIHSGSMAYAQFAPPKRPPAPVNPIHVNGIAAKVNGRVITINQVSFMLAPVFGNLAKQFPQRGPEFRRKFEEAKDKVTQELIDRVIILDEFEKMGGVVAPIAIDDEIKRHVREFHNGDKTKFQEDLDRARLTMEDYRKLTGEKMAVQAMRQRYSPDAPPPLPTEILKDYNEVKTSLRDMTKDVITFRKIFIPASDSKKQLATRQTQLVLAEEITKQLAEGADFAELAKQHSKGAFAEKGGIWEGVPRGDLTPGFATTVFDSKVDEIIGPLPDPRGFTIVKPIKIELGPIPPLDGEIRQIVEQRVRKRKNSAEYDRWIEVRRRRAMIQIER